MSDDLAAALQALRERVEELDRDRLFATQHKLDHTWDHLVVQHERIEHEHWAIQDLLFSMASELREVHRMAAIAAGEEATGADGPRVLTAGELVSAFALTVLAGVPQGAVVAVCGPDTVLLPAALAALGRTVLAVAPPSAAVDHPAVTRLFAPAQLPDRLDAAVVAGDLADLDEIALRLVPGGPVALAVPAAREAEVGAWVRSRGSWDVVDERVLWRTGPAAWTPDAAGGEGLLLVHAQRTG